MFYKYIVYKYIDRKGNLFHASLFSKNIANIVKLKFQIFVSHSTLTLGLAFHLSMAKLNDNK